MLMRKRPPILSLRDNSALVTGMLIAVAIPPLSPWWILAIGIFFAIIIGKHLYGGLGQNLFNPAMVAYVVLLISFPVQMTSWVSPESLAHVHLHFDDCLKLFLPASILMGYLCSKFVQVLTVSRWQRLSILSKLHFAPDIPQVKSCNNLLCWFSRCRLAMGEYCLLIRWARVSKITHSSMANSSSNAS